MRTCFADSRKKFLPAAAWIVCGLTLLAGCGSRQNGSSAPSPETPVSSTSPVQNAATGTIISDDDTPDNDRDRFNGAWKLVSFSQQGPGSATPYSDHPYTEEAVGRMTFDKAGRVSMFVMKPGRHASVNTTDGVALASMEDLRQIADGFLAFYGTFGVDEENTTLTATLEASTLPAWVNSQQKRSYEFTDDRLTLTTPSTQLVWERLPE